MPKETTYFVYEKPGGGRFISVQEKSCCKLLEKFKDRADAQRYIKITDDRNK